MKRISVILSIFMVMILAACTGGGGASSSATSAARVVGTQAAGLATSPVMAGTTTAPAAESAAGTPAGTSSVPQTGATAVVTGVVPQTGASTAVSGTGIVPQTGAATTPASQGTSVSGTPAAVAPTPSPTPASVAPPMTSLTGLLSYRVADPTGKVMGTINDFIINLCSDHIVYIVLAPDPALNISHTLLVPYDLTSFKTVDTEDFLVVNMDPAQLSGAPAFDPATASLENPTWAAATNAFWSKAGTVSQPLDCSIRASISSLVEGTAQANNPLSGTVQTAQPGATSSAGQLSGTALPAATMGGAGTLSGTSQPGGLTSTGTVTAAGTSQPAPTGASGGNYNLAYARSISYTNLEDTQGTVLGAVNTVLVRPEFGSVLYFVIQPFKASNLTQKFVAIPAPAVTVKRGAGVSSGAASGTAVATQAGTVSPAAGASTPQSGSVQATQAGTAAPAGTPAATAEPTTMPVFTPPTVALVLQVPVSVIQGAPAFDPKQDITTPGWDQSTVQYWSTRLPTTTP